MYGTISRSLEKYCLEDPSFVLFCIKLAIVVIHIWVNSKTNRQSINNKLYFLIASLRITYELGSF